MTLTELHNKYDVVGTIDLSMWSDDYQTSTAWLLRECQNLHQAVYTENQRIIFLSYCYVYLTILAGSGSSITSAARDNLDKKCFSIK